MDNYARAKLIVRTTLLHARETEAIVRGGAPVELSFVATPLGVLDNGALRNSVAPGY
jgi:hypothetical protein